MTSAKTRSFLALLLLSTSILFVAGCGGAGESEEKVSGPDAASQPATAGSTEETPIAPLPANSQATLEKVAAPDNNAEGALYIGDTSTGDIWRVKTQPDSWLSPAQWVSPTQLIAAGYYQDYYLLDLSTKTLRQLQASPAQYGVSFSHSGEFMAIPGPGGDLMLWSLKEDRQLAQITTGPTAYVSWSPDDKHIFWPGAPSGIGSVGPQPAVVAANMGDAARTAAWSSDGASIIFNGGDGIYSINADSGAKTLLYSWPAGVEPMPEAPKLSHDGKYALVAARDGEAGFRALIVPLDGGTRGAQVTSVWAEDAEWSPTEDVVAVIADWCKPESRLLLVNPDGSVRSTAEGAVQIPRFSADGSMVAYVGTDPQGGGTQEEGGLVVRAVEGNNLVAFLRGFHNDRAWSPDGHWLAYSPGPVPYQCADLEGTTQILPFP